MIRALSSTIFCLVTFLAFPVKAAGSPEAVVAGFEKRVEAMFRAESGRDLVRAKKRPPLAAGRSAYVRSYSYSMMSFAARCLYLDEMIEEANAALAENAQYYLDHPEAILDRDSFHWHADIVMRLVEMYGSKGSKNPGRLTPETEALILNPIWVYASKLSFAEKFEFEKSKTWHIYSSENHHSMDFTVCWHFAKLAKDRSEYQDRKFEDGGTPAEHFEGWNKYFVAYCLERARKGLCVEMMNDGYNSALIRGIYNFYDFGEPAVKRAAGQLLDLYFAYWAQEQIGGTNGGGKARVYFGKGLKQNRVHGIAPLAWFYFEMFKQPKITGDLINAALSNYRPPAVIADIALDHKGRGRYEIRQRPQGLGVQGSSHAQLSRQHMPSRLRTDGGGIVRYSFCDPSFILGTPMTEARPLSDWAHISIQNRWQGVVFPGADDARIVPVVRPKDSWRALNAQWSVQSKGSLITQKLKTNKGAAEMMVWFSKEGISEPVEEEGVVFVEADGAYAAVRIPSGGYEWQDRSLTSKTITGNRPIRAGRILVPKEEFATVILEVMAKSDVEGFEAFKEKVKSTTPVMTESVLTYTSIHGDKLTFDTSFKNAPRINGKPVGYREGKAFESPFLQADYNSGVVTIQKGARKKVLKFNE